MQANGYLEQDRRHPVSLGAATTIVLGTVAAMLAYQPQIVSTLIKDTDFIPIATPKPPPPVDPVKPQPRHARNDPAQPQPQPLDPIVDTTPRTIVDWPSLPPQPPQPPAPPMPEATTPVRQPVLIAAAIDGRRSGDLQPPYPAGLERAEIEGSVTVRVQVGTDGRVTDVELVRASEPGFYDATRETALRKWRFKPATRDGVPYASWVTKTVTFRIVRT